MLTSEETFYPPHRLTQWRDKWHFLQKDKESLTRPFPDSLSHISPNQLWVFFFPLQGLYHSLFTQISSFQEHRKAS